VAEEVVDVRSGSARVLGLLVDAAQPHRLFVQRVGAERLDLVGRHQPALQLEAAHRVGGELAEVVGLDAAEIALGGNVQADASKVVLRPLDSFRQRVYLAPLGLWLTLDAGRLVKDEG